jgi:hypothetical protein
MFRLLSCFLAGALAASASPAASSRYYALELKGGSQIFSADVPLKKERVLVFHRYPDGTYMSLAASEVEKIVAREGEPSKTEKLAPGETLYIGNAVEGPGYVMPEGPPPAPGYGGYYDPGYGYGEYWGGGYNPPPRPPGPPPPSRIGPNGFPILAPPGTAGSVPPPIGANGFPILAPPPAVASPRRR